MSKTNLLALNSSRVFRHACQTPLTTLINAADVASKNNMIDQDQSTYLNLAKTAAKRLTELFTYLEKPQSTTVFKIIDAIYEAASLISPRQADLRIVFNQKLRSKSPKLKGNRLYFTESLVCLLNNAHEATINSRLVPLILLTVNLRGKNHIQLDIIDTGPGMGVLSPTHIIWRKASSKHQGSGIGLWFAHQTLTQLFGGKIITTSTSHGTRVSISLPLHKKRNHKTYKFSHNWRTYLNAGEFFSRIRLVMPSSVGS